MQSVTLSRTCAIICCFFLLLVIPIASLGQAGSIVGKVFDSRSNESLPFANVYINHTTIGQATEADGSFKLKDISPGKCELIASFIGYNTQSVKVNIMPGELKNVTLFLTPSVIELKTVQVTAERDDDWKNQLRKFKRVFFGADQIASACVLLNPNVLSFSEIKSNGEVFTASASEPLQIINETLGYKVMYELKEFSSSAEFYNIKGNIFFTELESLDETLVKKWAENREKVYQVSLRYFLKAIIDNKVQESGFGVYREKVRSNEILRPAVFMNIFDFTLFPFEREKHLTKNDSIKIYTLRLDQNRLEVHDKRKSTGKTYKDIYFPVSWIDTSEPLLIAESGLLQNAGAIRVGGYMSDFRVAHTLPENYVPGEISSVEVVDPYESVGRSQERIFLHTDKDYYYPADILWFKGYAKHGDPRIGDSLSRVAYVEVIDTSLNILKRVVLPISDGVFYSSIDLPEHNGDFVVRAYTQWMRNFGDKNFFNKAIKVLDAFERVKETRLDTSTFSRVQVLVQPDKVNYKKREKIQLDLLITDEYGNPVAADMSISVTDFNVVKPLNKIGQMDSYFQMKYDTAKPLKQFQVEKGITLRGAFRHKHKGIATQITAVLGNMQDIVTFSSDTAGMFAITGFQFYDSSNIFLQALNKRKKSFGEFSLMGIAAPDVTFLPSGPSLSIERTKTAVGHVLDYNDGKTIMLKEIVVEAKKQDRNFKNQGPGDYAIDATTIEKTNPVDVLSLLQARIPGFRVFRYLDRTGRMRETVKIGPPTFFVMSSGGQQGAVGEPLLLIDGVPISSTQLVSDALRHVNVRDIVRVEVSKFGGAVLYGSRGSDGVIAIYTGAQPQNTDSKFSSVGFSAFPFFGYTPVRNFKMPDYSQASEDLYPDNRTTIYWNPDVWLDGVVKQSVSFYAANESTYYLVTVMGVTVNGDAVEYRKLIQVLE